MDIEKNDFVAKYGHWYLITDAQNLLSHKSIARIMYSDSKYCSKYVDFVQALQGTFLNFEFNSCLFCLGMNTTWRIVEGDHAEYESTLTAQRAFTLEWETCATVSFNTIQHLNSMEHLSAMNNIVWEIISRISVSFVVIV